MNTEDLITRVQYIVKEASTLRDKHIDEKGDVNYACIFSQCIDEYTTLLRAVQKIGEKVKETPTGIIFHINPIDTVSGSVRLLKIRLPDETRPELGDADFTISNFSAFKKKYLSKFGFKLIARDDCDMIELKDDEFYVRAYFSHPTLLRQLNIQ